MTLVGVLALQGGFAAHARMLRGLGADVREVRVPDDLDGLDGLIIPGGESTTMTLGIEREGLAGPLRAFARPVFGTCAGLIMLDRDHLGMMDIEARRNAFGRQVRSFEADLTSRSSTARRCVPCSSARRGSRRTARRSRSSRRWTGTRLPRGRATCLRCRFIPSSARTRGCTRCSREL